MTKKYVNIILVLAVIVIGILTIPKMMNDSNSKHSTSTTAYEADKVSKLKMPKEFDSQPPEASVPKDFVKENEVDKLPNDEELIAKVEDIDKQAEQAKKDNLKRSTANSIDCCLENSEGSCCCEKFITKYEQLSEEENFIDTLDALEGDLIFVSCKRKYDWFREKQMKVWEKL